MPKNTFKPGQNRTWQLKTKYDVFMLMAENNQCPGCGKPLSTASW